MSIFKSKEFESFFNKSNLDMGLKKYYIIQIMKYYFL